MSVTLSLKILVQTHPFTGESMKSVKTDRGGGVGGVL